VSAEESSPLEGSRYEPERSMRTKLIIIGVALVFVMAAYAYVGTRDRSLDIQDPALISQQQEDGLICCVTEFNHDGETYLAVVTRELEGEFRTVVFRVMEFDENGSPEEINAIGSPFEGLLPTRFSILDETAYVPVDGESGSGVWIADLSDPAWPESADFLETGEGTSRQLAADGDVLAINHTDSLTIVDISDRRDPQIASQLHQPESGIVSLKMNNGRLIVNDTANDEFRIYDLSNPGAPEHILLHENPDGSGELTFELGAEDPADRLDQTAIPSRYLDFTVVDDLVYLAASDLGLRMLDIADSDSPEIIGDLTLPDRAVRVAERGDRLYVLGASEGNVDELTYAIHIIDISDRTDPRLIETINGILSEPGIQAFSVSESEDRLYVGLYETLLVFDISE
jgi:hypothetical protein